MEFPGFQIELVRGEVLDRSLGVRRADAVEQLQHAEGAGRVPRVFGQPQDRQRVLDMRRFEELQAAVLHERDVPPGQLDFQRVAVVGGAEEDRLLAQRDARLEVLQDAADQVVALLVLVR